jgi:hypothetical protein
MLRFAERFCRDTILMLLYAARFLQLYFAPCTAQEGFVALQFDSLNFTIQLKRVKACPVNPWLTTICFQMIKPRLQQIDYQKKEDFAEAFALIFLPKEKSPAPYSSPPLC